nr:recombinase family protein [Clostridium frigoris]
MTVKLIYELYADGESMGSISARFESCSIPSPYNNPKWGKQAISKILSYERYIGDENYPKIIDEELINRVQRVRLEKAK